MLYESNFADYRLRIGGLVANPVELDLTELHALPHHEQITQHFCIQGWSGVAKWGGVSMQTILDLVKPYPEAKWVVFYSLGEGPDGGTYYDAHPIEQMSNHLTMLAYDMNDKPLSFGHGAPLRLRNEGPARLQTRQMDQEYRVRRRLPRRRRRLRRLQPGPRIFRLPPNHLTPDRRLRRTDPPTQLGKVASMEKSSLTALAREQLKIAQHASSGRSARTVYGGHEHVLRQTLIALAGGHKLDEHDNPGEATVHVLHGRVRLTAGDLDWEGSPGDLLIVPDARHSLEALEDSTVLLTVAKLIE
ncbi:MAG: oxidoreductase, molybdopterin-binding [Mycobacterium sp.]|nr:oxidoreductase, molybdopterin-binding [Mycobacterium sp.]